jgi:hypothetical protein
MKLLRSIITISFVRLVLYMETKFVHGHKIDLHVPKHLLTVNLTNILNIQAGPQ